jgi:hypothetical protein
MAFDPITGLPLLNADIVDQIPLNAQFFPWKDMGATSEPSRGPYYPDDIFSVMGHVVGYEQNNPRQDQVVYTDGNHRLLVDTGSSAGGFPGPRAQSSFPNGVGNQAIGGTSSNGDGHSLVQGRYLYWMDFAFVAGGDTPTIEVLCSVNLWQMNLGGRAGMGYVAFGIPTGVVGKSIRWSFEPSIDMQAVLAPDPDGGYWVDFLTGNGGYLYTALGYGPTP